MRSKPLAVLLFSLATACAAPEVPAVNTPTPRSVQNADAAIAAVKAQFLQVAKIQKKGAGMIGGTTDITALQRADGWDLVFWEGWGDCPAGCINNRYSYFSVQPDGRVIQAGEYTRVFDADKNSFNTTGAPMWGVPK